MKVKAKHVATAYAVITAMEKGESIPVDKISFAANVLFQAAMFDEARFIVERLITMMKRFLENRDIDRALLLETLLYRDCIRLIETEDNHRYWFNQWAPLFIESAHSRVELLGLPKPSIDGGDIGFVLHSGLTILGHTTVLLGFLGQLVKRRDPRRVLVFALDAIGSDLAKKLDDLSIGFSAPNSSVEEASKRKVSPTERIHWLRAAFETNHLGVAVWISTFQWAHYAFGLGLARRQVFWAMKFHSVDLGKEVVHACFGHPSEYSRSYFEKSWTVLPWPVSANYLHLEDRSTEAKSIRDEFRCEVLFGTLAREEKLDQAEFANAVCAILEENPKAHYLYTGRGKSAVLEREFKMRDLTNRVHFVGWVDTAIYSNVLDIFLETFPLGCAITGFQSMANGRPFISMWRDGTISRELHSQPESLLNEDPLTFHITMNDRKEGLCVATSSGQYVRYASFLARNPHASIIVGERCRQFVMDYGDGESLLADRLIALIDAD
jgi:glycosyltransferase involved in cell wall biosynthesis